MFSGNFESVAERKSIDKASAAHGGSIGYVIKEQIAIPEFANIAFLLKEGEISKPIKTKEGWHIVKVNSVRMVQPRGYEASRGDILETLKKEKYNQFLGGLKLDKMEKKIVLIGKTRVEWDKSAMTEEENAE
jgi:peptidyl-prolyl cis-trans isomerase C